jgi:hypothetical protein
VEEWRSEAVSASPDRTVHEVFRHTALLWETKATKTAISVRLLRTSIVVILLREGHLARDGDTVGREAAEVDAGIDGRTAGLPERPVSYHAI